MTTRNRRSVTAGSLTFRPSNQAAYLVYVSGPKTMERYLVDRASYGSGWVAWTPKLGSVAKAPTLAALAALLRRGVDMHPRFSPAAMTVGLNRSILRNRCIGYRADWQRRAAEQRRLMAQAIAAGDRWAQSIARSNHREALAIARRCKTPILPA